jgi:hypothetical protein
MISRVSSYEPRRGRLQPSHLFVTQAMSQAGKPRNFRELLTNTPVQRLIR